MFPKIVKSISGKRIRLTEERWKHIKQRHREITKYLDKVLETVADPELITAFFTRSRKYFEKRGIIWNKH